MMSTAFAVYEGAEITDVLDICPDGMILCLADDRYQFIHMDEIEIEWRSE